MGKEKTTLYEKIIDTSVSADVPLEKRLTPFGRKLVNEVLNKEAKHLGCNTNELVWGIDSVGAIRVKPPKKPETIEGTEKVEGVETFKFNGYKMKTFPMKGVRIEIPSKSKPEWSQPLGLKKWSEIFGVSVSTIRRWFRSKPPKIANEQVSPRKWRVKLDELPKDIVDRVKKELEKQKKNQNILDI